MEDYQIVLTLNEKIACLKEITNKLKKILYVYDKSQEPQSNYHYKDFCSGIAVYVSSSNILFDGKLVDILINLNAILTNDFDKSQIKKLVFESINFSEFLLKQYKKEKELKYGRN